jgi:hypothetical protein
MARQGRFLNPLVEYLEGSPLVRLLSWMRMRNSTTSAKATSKMSSRISNQVESDNAKVDGTSIPQVSNDEGSCLSALETRNMNLDNNVHDWPLARRVFIAAIISLYT